MSNTQSILSPENANALAKWLQHSFYKDAIVLGLDIGLEGIGVHVRKGPDILYGKTWAYDVPLPARLEPRRQLRAARHCRANRRTRQSRLKTLFLKHDLPWLAADSDEMLRSDPFILRHRAISSANGLASKKALSLAIRHCVAHRGHDYHYFNDEGALPWGEGTDFKKVMKALPSLFLMEEEIQTTLLEAENFGWKAEELADFTTLMQSRLATDLDIATHLAIHAKGDKNHLRTSAKGKAFPRTLVRAHLEKIITRHAHMVPDADAFLSALFVEPKDEESKARSIFFFHRKTPQEMRDHFAKKKAHCAYAMWLAGKEETVGTAGDIHVRRWRVLEFAATRDLELETKGKAGKKRWRAPLGDGLVQRILGWLDENHEATQKKQVAPLKEEIIAALTTKHSATIAPSGGKNGSVLNDYFFKTLADLLALSKGKRTDNAPLSSFAAERLYAIATAGGADFSRDGINERLKDCSPLDTEKGVSLFDFRRFSAGDLYGVYPQVEFLLGQRVKKAKGRSKTEPKKRGDTAVKGKLQLLFERELAPILGPNAKPDFCISEVIRDIPRTTKQKKEREDAIAENTERRIATFKQYGITDDGDRATWQKLKLYASQDGISPYTGAQLPAPNTAGYKNDLEVEHLYPSALGGLTVTENLVVTFKDENTAKDKRTPREYAAKLGKPFAEMLALTEKMRWGKHGKNEDGNWFSKKREVFAWEDSSVIPDLGNTTRVAQLAKQLQSALGHWLGCKTAEEIAQRIGSPSGFQTSVCRMAWHLPKKDRPDLTHHLVDAAILAHIPPREGQNYVRSGGIFYPDSDPKNPKRELLRALPLGPDVAAIERLSQHDGDVCPLIKHRSTSRHRPMHDKTIFRVLPDGRLAYRAPFPAKEDIADSAALRTLLVAMGIASTYTNYKGEEHPLIPNEHALTAWLDSKDAEPLRLMNRTPVKVIWKFCGKGNLTDNPVGFHAEWSEDHTTLAHAKSILGRWAGLELWRGWSAKRKCWEYYKKIIPAPGVQKALRNIGISWKKKTSRKWRKDAPELNEPLGKTLGGPLPPYARPAVLPGTQTPVVFRVGSVFRTGISADGKIAKRQTVPARHEWLEVAAVMAEGYGRLRLLSLVSTDSKKHEPMSPDDLAHIAGLPTADDSSSYPTQRPPGPPRNNGPVDFRLQ